MKFILPIFMLHFIPGNGIDPVNPIIKTPILQTMELTEGLRLWLRRTDYANGEDIWTAAVSGCTHAQSLVTFGSGIRFNRKTRHTFGELHAMFQSPTTRKRGPFLRSIHSLYSSMRVLCVPRKRNQEHDALYNLTKEQRTLLSGSGVVQQRRESIVSKAARCREQFKEWTQGQALVVHFDNFNRLRYLANPASGRDRSINACAFAVLRLPRSLPLFSGFPTLEELHSRVSTLTKDILAGARKLSADIDDVLLSGYRFHEIRAPLDVRRTNVLGPLWRPWQMTDSDTSKQQGLVQALHEVEDITRHCGVSHVPILVDVNLFSRCMKLMYSSSYTFVDMRSWFRRHPVHFGAWHAYKQCVHTVYNAFLPYFVFMEYEPFRSNPETTSVGNFPKLITKECMVAALFLHGRVLRGRLEQSVKNMGTGTNEMAPKVCGRLQALHNLLFQYVPALFLVGYLVRTSYWEGVEPNTGEQAYICLQYCYVILSSLGGGRSLYCYNIALALLQWHNWHSHLPGSVHVEEALEAMLSRLSRTMRSDLTVHTVEEINMLFGSLRVHDVQRPKDLKATHLSETLCVRVKQDLGDLYRAIITDKLPFVAHKSSGGSVVGSWMWPTKFSWPGPLMRDPASHDIHANIKHALHAVVQPSKISDNTMEEITPMLHSLLEKACIPPSTTEDIRQRSDMANKFLHSKKRRRSGSAPDRLSSVDQCSASSSTQSVGVQVDMPCSFCSVPETQQDEVHGVDGSSYCNPIDLEWEPEWDSHEDF